MPDDPSNNTPDPAANGGDNSGGSTWNPASLFNPEKPGAFVEKWQEKLPDEFADYRGIAADATDLKGLLHRTKTAVQAAREKAGLRRPPDDAPAEVKAAFEKELRAFMGVPDDLSGYGIEAKEGSPLNLDGGKESFQAVAHELGLTKEQAVGLKERYEAHHARLSEAAALKQKEIHAAEIAELDKTYGVKLPGAVELAQRAAHGEGWPAESFDPKSEKFIGFEAFKLVHSLAEKLAKASANDPFPGAGAVKNDPAGIEWAKAVQSDPSHPDHARWKAGDAVIMARIKDAYARAFPGEGKD